MKNETEKFAIECDIELCFIAYSTWYQGAVEKKKAHAQKTGHPIKGIHIRFPKRFLTGGLKA